MRSDEVRPRRRSPIVHIRGLPAALRCVSDLVRIRAIVLYVLPVRTYRRRLGRRS